MKKLIVVFLFSGYLFADSMEIVPTVMQDPSTGTSPKAAAEENKPSVEAPKPAEKKTDNSSVIKSDGPPVQTEKSEGKSAEDKIREVLKGGSSSGQFESTNATQPVRKNNADATRKDNASSAQKAAPKNEGKANQQASVTSPKSTKGAATKKSAAKKNEQKKTTTPEITGPMSEDRALLESGIMFYNSANYAASIEKLKQLKDKFPQSQYNDLASQWLAKSYLKIGDYKRAESSLDSIPAESGEYPAAVYYAGQLAFSRKDYPAAAERFYRVSAVFPMHELADDALVSLARTNVMMKNGNLAVENLLKVIKNYSDRETLDDAYYNLARVYEDDARLRDLERARSLYRKFIEKADAGDPVFAQSPLLGRVKRDLEYLNKRFFSETPMK